MKYLILFLLLSTSVAAQIDHVLPQSAQIGSDLTVALQLRGATPGERVIIGEKLPPNTSIISWNIINARESKDNIGFYNDGRVLVWSFTAKNSRPQINYVITLPNQSSVKFQAVYALPSSDIGHDEAQVSLITPTANVVVQNPSQEISQKKGSWTSLFILLSFIAIIALLVHYAPKIDWQQLKSKVRFKKVDVKKIEGEFSSWLTERIDHHKERVAKQPTPEPSSTLQASQSQPSQSSSKQPQSATQQVSLSTQASQDNDALERLNAGLPPTLFSSEIPHQSFDEEYRPLRPEDYQEEERII